VPIANSVQGPHHRRRPGGNPCAGPFPTATVTVGPQTEEGKRRVYCDNMILWFSWCGANTVRATSIFSIVAMALVGVSCLPGCQGCERDLEREAVKPSDVVEAFLLSRGQGHSGEQYWRNPVPETPPYRRMTDEGPINPTEWRQVFTKSGGGNNWVLARYRVKSTTPAGVPIDKLWDFCLNRIASGYGIVGVWDADDGKIGRCEESPTWVRYVRSNPEPPGNSRASPAPTPLSAGNAISSAPTALERPAYNRARTRMRPIPATTAISRPGSSNPRSSNQSENGDKELERLIDGVQPPSF
jgi:hypothetical protein